MVQFDNAFFVYVKGNYASQPPGFDLRTVSGFDTIAVGDPTLGLNSVTVTNLSNLQVYSYQIIGEYPDNSEDIGKVLTFQTSTESQEDDDQVVTISASSSSIAATMTMRGGYGQGTSDGTELDSVFFYYAPYVSGTPPADLRGVPGVVRTVNQAPPAPVGQYQRDATDLQYGQTYMVQAAGVYDEGGADENFEFGQVLLHTIRPQGNVDERVQSISSTPGTNIENDLNLTGQELENATDGGRDIKARGFVWVHDTDYVPGTLNLATLPNANFVYNGPGQAAQGQTYTSSISGLAAADLIYWQAAANLDADALAVAGDVDTYGDVLPASTLDPTQDTDETAPELTGAGIGDTGTFAADSRVGGHTDYGAQSIRGQNNGRDFDAVEFWYILADEYTESGSADIRDDAQALLAGTDTTREGFAPQTEWGISDAPPYDAGQYLIQAIGKYPTGPDAVGTMRAYIVTDSEPVDVGETIATVSGSAGDAVPPTPGTTDTQITLIGQENQDNRGSGDEFARVGFIWVDAADWAGETDLSTIPTANYLDSEAAVDRVAPLDPSAENYPRTYTDVVTGLAHGQQIYFQAAGSYDGPVGDGSTDQIGTVMTASTVDDTQDTDEGAPQLVSTGGSNGETFVSTSAEATRTTYTASSIQAQNAGATLTKVEFWYAPADENTTSPPPDVRALPGGSKVAEDLTPVSNAGSNGWDTPDELQPKDTGQYWVQAIGHTASGEVLGASRLYSIIEDQTGEADTDEDAETGPNAPVPADADTQRVLTGTVTPSVANGEMFSDSKFYIAENAAWSSNGQPNDLSTVPGAIVINNGDPDPGTQNQTVTGLSPSTAYRYQFVGLGGPGTDLGAHELFTTGANPGDTVAQDDTVIATDGEESPYRETSRDLDATHFVGTTHGDELETIEFWVAPVTAGVPPGADLRDHPSASLKGSQSAGASNPETKSLTATGLTKGTTYHYQAVGRRSSTDAWEYLSNIVQFRTAEGPPFEDEDIETLPATPSTNPSSEWTLNATVVGG